MKYDGYVRFELALPKKLRFSMIGHGKYLMGLLLIMAVVAIFWIIFK